MFYIYGLIDPNTKELRYVGKTNNLKIRYQGHLDKINTKNHKSNWIKGLIKNGSKPEMIVIEEYEDESDCFEAEIFFIQYFKSIGSRLTNLTDGGEGTSGFKHSQNTKNKIALSHTGMKAPEEVKQKMSKSQIDKPKIRKILPNDNFGKNARINQVLSNSNRKLSSEQNQEIRKLYAGKEFTQKQLAIKYGVNQQQISRIVNFKRGIII